LYTRPIRPVDPRLPGRDQYRTEPFFYRLAERIQRPRSLRQLLKGPSHVFALARLGVRLVRWRPDIIHFQWLAFPLIDRIALLVFRRIAPVVHTAHNTTPFHGDALRGPASFLAHGWHAALSRFDGVIAHTAFSVDRLTQLGVDPGHTVRIDHGVLSAPREAVVPRSEPRAPTILFFGNVRPYKGLDVLIDALGILNGPMARETRLVVAGRPHTGTTAMRERAAAAGVADKIDWQLRFIPEEELPGLFADADAVVFPYLDVDASGALMLALPYGRPIVASRLGVFEEVLEDGRDALLVSPGDPDALADALNRILAEPEWAHSLGRRSAQLAEEEFGWPAIARRTLEFYETVTATTSS
jgi:glycosyltransferase involved in cell wall biosynthesis